MVTHHPGFVQKAMFSLLLLVSCIGFANARHIVGGEIFYECLGPGSITDTRNYRLTMKIYRDCAGQGAGFDSPARMGLYSHINGVYAFVRMIDASHLDVIDLESNGNPCLTLPASVCVEETSYRINLINLPIIEGSYIASWQRCCRNNTISNIVAPHNTGATYTIEITETAQNTCNDGPRFRNFPPIGLCVNDPLEFDHGAIDAEGDQLVYEFCAPLRGGGPLGVDNGSQADWCDGITPDPRNCFPPYLDVTFVAPTYSPASPLGVNSDININPVTGVITGVPKLIGQFVLGVCVKEYRNGVLLSELRRDFQFNVVNCQATVNALIEADAVVDGKEFVLNSCGENTVTFINESQKESKIKNYHWEFDLGGTTAEVFTRHATVTFPGIGSYKGSMIVNEGEQCGDTAYIHVNIYPSINADFEFDYDTCTAGPVAFRDKSHTNAQELTDWDWSFGDAAESPVRNPNHIYQDPGVHPVTLISTDNNNCKDTMVQMVNYFPVPPAILVKPSKFVACVPEVIRFNNLSAPIDETYDIRWDFGDGGIGDSISPSHEYQTEGTYTVKVEITSPIGCYIEETFENVITMEASPEAGFSFTPEVVNSINSTASFSDESVGAVSWFWDFGGRGSSFQQSPTYTFQDTGIHDVMQVVFHPNGCADTMTQRLDVEAIVQFFLPNAFTPNYDGKNEVYKPGGLSSGMKFYRLTIWSRWGDLIFETNDPEDGWNGQRNNNGQEMPVGVYLCHLEYHDARNRVHEIKEFVTLIR
jgi:gliding motility-associated-like protein